MAYLNLIWSAMVFKLIFKKLILKDRAVTTKLSDVKETYYTIRCSIILFYSQRCFCIVWEFFFFFSFHFDCTLYTTRFSHVGWFWMLCLYYLKYVNISHTSASLAIWIGKLALSEQSCLHNIVFFHISPLRFSLFYIDGVLYHAKTTWEKKNQVIFSQWKPFTKHCQEIIKT